jgi:ABC-type transport system involved in multi-copper enzyme maturation permease subunit
MVESLFWRPLPILTLTVRQFLGGKLVRVAVALTFLPCLFAAIYLLNTRLDTPRAALVFLFQDLVAPLLLPITVLILATAALGNEVEDRTLPYLTLKPITRLRIVLEKLGGVLVVALPAVLAGLLATAAIISQGQDDYARLASRLGEERLALAPVVVAMLGAAAVGVVMISAVFLTISLIIPRALLAGLIYAFAWERALGPFLPGIRVVSTGHYVRSVFVALLDDPTVTLENATSLRGSLITVAVTCVVAIAIATWRLRRMNIE